MQTQEIMRRLESFHPGTVEVVHEMAAIRGLDPKGLTADQYRLLIKEEAEFSLEATPLNDPKERADAEVYSAGLLAIAKMIG